MAIKLYMTMCKLGIGKMGVAKMGVGEMGTSIYEEVKYITKAHFGDIEN